MENKLLVSCLLTMSAIKLTTTAFPLADITEDPIFQVVDLKRSKGKYTGKHPPSHGNEDNVKRKGYRPMQGEKLQSKAAKTIKQNQPETHEIYLTIRYIFILLFFAKFSFAFELLFGSSLQW